MLTLFLGFIVHLIFLLSVFDVYFRSPLLTDLSALENSIEPRAKRLVLIVGDGLRTDSLFSRGSDGLPHAPCLRSILETEASWGISHTRVPTESRPGHIAMIAGFYEDPSAIFKGWQDNLVEFDSLFNRSHLTLGWGSPDIVSIFNKGDVTKNMVLRSYPAGDQRFFGSNNNSFLVNQWVLNAVSETLKEAEFSDSKEQLKRDLNQDRIILFLHLLGTDISGHSDKPKSLQFFDVLRQTDAIVKAAVERTEKFYGHDNKTLYVFTSDHGMTDWGSHGDGSSAETETPFIIWGPGVKKAEVVGKQEGADPWGVSHLARRDLRQADIVPLLALLIGISIPVNSIGVLPTDFLNVTDREKAAMLQLNMFQINLQFAKRRDYIKRKSLPFLYFPFKKLTDKIDEDMKNKIQFHMDNMQFKDAIAQSRLLIQLSLEAIDYYQNYYQYLLLCCVSISYFGWVFILLAGLTNSNTCHQKTSLATFARSSELSSYRKLSSVEIIFALLAVSVIVFVGVQRLPFQFYIYGLIPLFLWWLAFKNHLIALFKTFFKSFDQYWIQLFGYVFGIELFVLTFFHRWAISFVVLSLISWPLSNYNYLKRKNCLSLCYLWILTSAILALFPFLPISSGLEPNVLFVILSGCSWLIVILGMLLVPAFERLFILKSKKTVEPRLTWNVIRHIIALGLTIFNCFAVSHTHEEGLHSFNQFLSWTLLGNALIVPVNFIERDVSFRLIIFFLSMASPILGLSIGCESIFYFVFSVHLLLWFALEHQLELDMPRGVIGKKSTSLTPATWRRGFFFLTFILLSFFGAGNIASISSFEVLSVRRYITVFSPFLMMSLILLRIFIPVLLVVTTVFCLYNRSQNSLRQLLFIVLIFCDMLGLHFLFLVKNVGSWKEIGMSLSHFVIAESFILFVLLALGIAHLYLQKIDNKFIYSSLNSGLLRSGFALSKKQY